MRRPHPDARDSGGGDGPGRPWPTRRRRPCWAVVATLLAALAVSGAASPQGQGELDGVQQGGVRQGGVQAAGGRMNVVVVLTDDQTMASLTEQPAGYPPVMPYLQERMADRGDSWVSFSSAYVNTALCCSSRATILTGQTANHTGVLSNQLARTFREHDTIAATLHEQGWRTAMFGKYLNGYPWQRGDVLPYGWDDAAVLDYRVSQETYYDYRLIEPGGQLEPHGSQPGDYLTDVLAGKAVDFLRRTPVDQPFFLYVTPTAGHHPWTPAPRHVDRYQGMPPRRVPSLNEADVSDKPSWVRKLPLLTPAGIARWDEWRRHALETLPAADDLLRDVVEELRASGRLDRTMVVFMSDHGHMFGEHRVTRKKCPYEECEHIPLVIRYPGAAARTERALVGNVDIAPTIADATGVRQTIPVDGTSLLPLLTGVQPAGTAWRTALLLRHHEDVCIPKDPCRPPYWGLRTRDYTYLEYENGERELYDETGRIRPKDPFQLQNRVTWPAYANVVAALHEQLAKVKAGAAGSGAVPVGVDEQPR